MSRYLLYQYRYDIHISDLKYRRYRYRYRYRCPLLYRSLAYSLIIASKVVNDVNVIS